MAHTIGYECPGCGPDVEVEAEYEPADASYGADADGNRGMYVPESWSAKAPEKCPLCGMVYTPEQQAEIQKWLDTCCNEPGFFDNDPANDVDWDDRDD